MRRGSVMMTFVSTTSLIFQAFRVLKFEMFNNTRRQPHLRLYCDQILGIGRNKPILMKLLSRSLNRPALEWLTTQELNNLPK